MRFWAPGSPPQAFCLARFDARRACGPAVCRRDGVAVRGGLRTGSWTRAKQEFLNLCFAVDFESNSIVRFDRFVIIFSVMICRLGIC